MANDVVVNFDTADAVVVGECLLNCVKATPGVSGAGNHKIDLQLKVLETTGDESFVGRIVFDTVTLTVANLWRVKQATNAFGVRPPSGPVSINAEITAQLAAQFVDKQTWASITPEEGKGEYEGTVRSRVKKYGI